MDRCAYSKSRYTWLIEDIINAVALLHTETPVFKELHLLYLMVLRMLYDSENDCKILLPYVHKCLMFPWHIHRCDGHRRPTL